MDQTFKMAEPHGLRCAKIFADFILHEGVLISSSKYFTLFYMISSTFDITVVAVLSQFAMKIPERFASVVDPDRHCQCDKQDNFQHFTLVLFRAKSFQIGLIHSLLCFWHLFPLIL